MAHIGAMLLTARPYVPAWVVLGFGVLAGSAPVRGQVQDRPAPVRCERPLPDPSTHIPIDGRPIDVLTDPTGCRVFVTVNRDSAPNGMLVLHRDDAAIRPVRFIELEGNPFGMRMHPNGQLIFVAGGDNVSVIDIALAIYGGRQPVVGVIRDSTFAGAVMVNVTVDSSLMFVSLERANGIAVVDLRAWHPTAQSMTGPIGETEVVDGRLAIVDGAIQRPAGYVGALRLGHVPTGRAPIAVELSPDGRRLYATSQEAPPSMDLPVDCRPQADRGGPPDHRGGAVLVIDVEKARTDPASATVSMVRAGCNPVRLVVTPDGDGIYVTARTDAEVLAFDTRLLEAEPSRAQVRRIKVGTAPVGLILVGRGDALVVTSSNRFAGTDADQQDLYLVEPGLARIPEFVVAGRIRAGAFPRQLHLAPDRRTLYVTNFASRTLQVIDLARVPVGSALVPRDSSGTQERASLFSGTDRARPMLYPWGMLAERLMSRDTVARDSLVARWRVTSVERERVELLRLLQRFPDSTAAMLARLDGERRTGVGSTSRRGSSSRSDSLAAALALRMPRSVTDWRAWYRWLVPAPPRARSAPPLPLPSTSALQSAQSHAEPPADVRAPGIVSVPASHVRAIALHRSRTGQDLVSAMRDVFHSTSIDSVRAVMGAMAMAAEGGATPVDTLYQWLFGPDTIRQGLAAREVSSRMRQSDQLVPVDSAAAVALMDRLLRIVVDGAPPWRTWWATHDDTARTVEPPARGPPVFLQPRPAIRGAPVALVERYADRVDFQPPLTWHRSLGWIATTLSAPMRAGPFVRLGYDMPGVGSTTWDLMLVNDEWRAISVYRLIY